MIGESGLLPLVPANTRPEEYEAAAERIGVPIGGVYAVENASPAQIYIRLK